jgi:NtrC-family two-component system sensor histidine kinase KinB
MQIRSLQTRFLLAGGLLVLMTVVCGIWSIVTFSRLSAEVDSTLRESQEAIELTARLADTVEREDDALLLAIAGKLRNARSDVGQLREEFDDLYSRLLPRLSDAEAQQAAHDLREHEDAYRKAGDALLERGGQPGARELYQEQVNPALRKAVADCSHIRELNFRAMQQVRLQARGEAARATGIVSGIALVALGLSTLVTVRLAQGILHPIHELTRSVDAIRRDDFKCRVSVDREDELGQLAVGFNRMAETLGEYRDSSLGELLLAKTTLEATLAALPDAVIVVDPDSAIVSKNPLAEETLKALALGGKEITDARNLPLSETILRDLSETLRTGRAVGTRQDLNQALSVSLSGRQLKMLVTVVPIPEFLPRRAGAAIVLADVTDLARLDELRGEVVAVASHELKTPLTSLQMNLMLLREKADNLTERQREILAAAVRGGEELGATVDELLDVTRIEAGQLRLARQRVDLAAVIDHVVRNVRQRFDDASVTLQVINNASTNFVQGDAARLGIVLVNLLNNALKYTPRNGKVTVRLASMQNAAVEGDRKLQITVTDTGSGIPAEFHERVFDKFFRVEDQEGGSPKGVRGTGIGLYLCREIIEAHGGTISCAAGEHGTGTQIAITLPAETSGS